MPHTSKQAAAHGEGIIYKSRLAQQQQQQQTISLQNTKGF
jgi:hypothetical protein